MAQGPDNLLGQFSNNNYYTKVLNNTTVKRTGSMHNEKYSSRGSISAKSSNA